MAHRTIGQKSLAPDGTWRSVAALERLSSLIDWQPGSALLAPLEPSAKGEPPWPLLLMFKGQFKVRASSVKTCTLVDATIIASASKSDGETRWVKHRNRTSVHGFKAHVGADAETALVEQVAVAPANVHDGREGLAALPDDPADVFADVACRGQHFEAAVRPGAARCGSP